MYCNNADLYPHYIASQALASPRLIHQQLYKEHSESILHRIIDLRIAFQPPVYQKSLPRSELFPRQTISSCLHSQSYVGRRMLATLEGVIILTKICNLYAHQRIRVRPTPLKIICYCSVIVKPATIFRPSTREAKRWDHLFRHRLGVLAQETFKQPLTIYFFKRRNFLFIPLRHNEKLPLFP